MGELNQTRMNMTNSSFSHAAIAKRTPAGKLLPVRAMVTFMLCALLSSCVSSTLDTGNTAPAKPTSVLALSEEEQLAELRRADGIAQIRAKADAAPVNEEEPAYGLPRKGETELLSDAEIAEKTSAVNAASAQADEQIPDSELLAHQKKMNALRKKGSSHYKSALTKIEKK